MYAEGLGVGQNFAKAAECFREAAERGDACGIFFKKQRQIRLESVQSVDISRSLVARILGLSELRLEAADGAKEAPAYQIPLACESAEFAGTPAAQGEYPACRQ